MVAETTEQRHVIPLAASDYPGLPRDTIVIESHGIRYFHLDGDGVPDVSHDRADGTTLIHYIGEWRNLLRTIVRNEGTFCQRFVGAGTVEVNLEPELPPFASASRNAITPEQEERAEVSMAAAVLGCLGPWGSPGSRMDWNTVGRLGPK